MSNTPLTVEFIKRRRHGPRDEDPDTKAEKMRRVHTRGLRVTLADGGSAWVDQIDVRHVYLGLIDGLPVPSHVTRAVAEGVRFAREQFPGPPPVVLNPAIYEPGSAHPLLPPLRFTAQVVSWRRLDPLACGSWLNLVWFAELDDEKPLTAFVTEALRQVDWSTQATSFDI